MENLQVVQTVENPVVVKALLPNLITPTLDFAHESKQQFIEFLIEIEVDQYRPWSINWINSEWTDGDIADYMKNGYDGLLDYDILVHMDEYRKAQEGKQLSLVS